MDFGKLPHAALATVDFTLPPEPESNCHVLPGVRAGSPNVYVGCPRWGVKELLGKLYPKGTKDTQFLDEYIKQFNAIELNSTFYNIYDDGAVSKWAAKAGESEFKFCPKVFQGISHEGALTDKLPLTHAFEKSIAAFGKHLGPAFLQLHDSFGPRRKGELLHYLQELPPQLPLFVEVRHPAWFEAVELDNLVAQLSHLNKGLVITDTAGRRDVCHLRLTTSKAMVRFVANNLHSSDYTRLDEWVQRIADWINNGLSELYFFIHMASEKHSPELAAFFLGNLNATCGVYL